MSDETTDEFAPEMSEDSVTEDSTYELDGDEFDADDFDDSESDNVFDSNEADVTDYLDVVSTDSALALFALPTTGEPRVDDALGRLADLESLPVHEHVEVFEDVQRRLHDTLADLAGS